MDISLFDYALPERLIAQFPTRKRGESRLLVLNRTDGNISHHKFTHILDYLAPGDGLIVNNTKVFKARLWGHRASGARVEVFLVRPSASATGEVWEALVSPSRRVKEGESILFSESGSVQLLRHFGEGRWQVGFASRTARQRIVSQSGHIPLPHYIDRVDQPSDVRRYQTLFAGSDKEGAVAAPTAGFHFSKSLLRQIAAKGVSLITLTLHVGPGTFKPVKTDRIEDHQVDPEYAELSPVAAGQINDVKANGGKLWVVGTTSVRTLESAKTIDGKIRPFAGMVDLYVQPGFRFASTDHLITNFHLPKSSLLILVSAFAGRERLLGAYQQAIQNDYRFYSYGDAMLIL
jgi:S-adenosylmethionine:tRNA ribosyltransferase-isomerase